ncbi:sensor histidine kinase [Bifidobacterium dolichotidis]|nr:ATP-binding protein [Bifidobacterium dolichotidis]
MRAVNESARRRALAEETERSQQLGMFNEGVPRAKIGIMERRMADELPIGLMICLEDGVVLFRNTAAATIGQSEHDDLCIAPECICEIIEQVSNDDATRDREVTIDNATYSVRIVSVGSSRFAVLLEDIDKVREAERVQRDFISNVSHELKTPAGAISLLAETIADAADDAEAVKHFAGRIMQESERLRMLVGDIVELSSAANPRKRPTEFVDMIDIAREAITATSVQATARDIAVELYADGQRVPAVSLLSTAPKAPQGRHFATCMRYPVFGCHTSLVMVLKNLIENAIRYSDSMTQISVALDIKGDRVVIRVIDQGIGIPEGEQQRIFERFYRVDQARSRDTGGSGLGLAIVQAHVAECGGTIDVWSRQGEGTTFTIRLPLASSSPHNHLLISEEASGDEVTVENDTELTPIGGEGAGAIGEFTSAFSMTRMNAMLQKGI